MGKWLERIRSYPSGIRTLLTYTFISGLGAFMYSGLVTPFARSLGMSPTSIGLYFSTFSFVSMFTSLAGGVLGDRFGHSKMLVAGRVFSVLQILLFVFARDWRWFIVIAMVRGFVDLMQGSLTAITARVADDSNRATVFGVVMMVQSSAGVIGPLIGGFVADSLGARMAFALTVPVMLLAVYLARRLGAEEQVPQPRARAMSPNVPPGPSFFSVIRMPEATIARLALCFAVTNGVHNAVLGLTLPLFVQDRFGVMYAGVSGIGVASSLGTMLTAVLGGRLADKYGKAKVGGVLMAMGAVPMFLLPLSPSLTVLYIAMFAGSLIGNAAGPPLQALMMECIPATVRGGMTGAFMAMFGISFSVANLVAGRLYGINPTLAFALMYVNMSLQLLFVLWMLYIAYTRGHKWSSVPAATPAAQQTDD